MCALKTANLLLQVMKEVNNLMRVPELSATMQQMSKEMMKAGMIDEMMGDAIDDALDSEDMEEETDQEVEKASGQGLLYLRCTSWRWAWQIGRREPRLADVSRRGL